MTEHRKNKNLNSSKCEQAISVTVRILYFAGVLLLVVVVLFYFH